MPDGSDPRGYEPAPVNTPPTMGSLQWDGDRAAFAKAFVAAQKATEAVKKASTNPAFRSKYADLAGVVEAVVPALNENGIAVMQAPAFDGRKVSVTTTLIHESGASVTSVLDLAPSKSDPQGVGSATTYARRYALLAMTGAAPEDDDGNAASGPTQRPQAQPPAKRDTGPGPVDGKDFWGCEGPGASANTAKKQGWDDVFDRMQEEIRAVATTAGLREWIETNRDDIRPLPLSWRQILREECEERGRELGTDPNERKAH